MSLVTLRLLGVVDLSNGQRGVMHTVLAQPKRLALLVYLTVARPELQNLELGGTIKRKRVA